MKKGFTLVELSIVLVIVGLLVGGILIGQSLIESAKLTALVQQIQQYDIATQSFKDKFKVLPGESGLVYTISATGGNPARKDGLLTDDDKMNNNKHFLVTGSAEYMLFWKDLAVLGNLRIKNCPKIATTAPAGNSAQISGVNCNQPRADYGDNKNIMIFAASTNLSPPQGNSYYLLDQTLEQSIFWNCTGASTQIEAMAYDSKIDDGKPNTGTIKAGTVASNCLLLETQRFTFPTSYDINSTTKMVIIQKFANGL